MTPLLFKGIYASPDAIALSPEYFQELIRKAGINFFVIRSGFSPEEKSGLLLKAIDMVRREDCHVCILAGTWWGGQTSPKSPSRYRSHEAFYPAKFPGGSYDEVIAENLDKLCRTAAPDSICLTHARYRHPAYIEDLTTEPGDIGYLRRMKRAGLEADELRNYWNLVRWKLKSSSFASLLSMMKGRNTPVRGLEHFLELLTGSRMFTDYINFRCHSIEAAVSVFHDTVKSCGSQIRFGSNACVPTLSRLCGQDYDALTGIYDFIQPLLGYMEWHMLEPLEAWTQFFRHYGSLSDNESFRLALAVFSLDGFPGSTPFFCENKADVSGEGSPDQIRYIVASQLNLMESWKARCELMPVLRGKDWDMETTEFLYDSCRSLNYTTVLFQGTHFLLPHTEIRQPGWN